jgi:opacity protein-like surface antigen
MRIGTLGLALAAATFPGMAHADGGLRGLLPEGSYYVRGEAGVTGEGEVELELRGALSSEQEINTPEGWTGAIGVGWASPNSGLRVEALVEYSEADADRAITIPGHGLATFTETYALGGAWLMAHYDFMHTRRLQPSIGIGIGAVWYDNQIDMAAITVGGVTTQLSSNWDPDLAPGIRLTAGLGYVLTDRWVGEVGYRYFYAEGLEHSMLNGGVVQIAEADVQSHALTAAVRYTFGRIER